MEIHRSQATAVIDDGHDFPFLLVFGLAASCFIGALFLDLVYARSPDFMWVTFSVWLITIGLIIAALAVVVGLIDRVMRHRTGTIFRRWPWIAGFAAATVVSIFNAFVHSRDQYQAVVPDGVLLSIFAVALIVATPFFARSLARRTLPLNATEIHR